jgi:hypothetical protein
VRNPPDTRRASRAFEDFTGRKARKVTVEKIDDGPVTGWEMGPLVGVAYEAVRDGQRDRYFHEFAKSARPRLVARDDGRQLYIAGGRYNVTERGVEDMPSPLFVVNPSRRKGKSMAARKSSTRKRRRGSAATIVVRQNPTHRRRPARAKRRRSGFLANPASRRRTTRRRSYRRNPSLRGGREKLMNLIVAGGGIGLGAVGSEILVGYLPLPPAAKTGTMLYVTKGAVGIAAGLLIGKVLKQPRLGKYVAAGAVAIAVHDAAKSLLLKSMPSVKFGQFMEPGRLGYASPAMLASPGSFAGVGEFVPGFRGLEGAGPSGGGGGETDFRV